MVTKKMVRKAIEKCTVLLILLLAGVPGTAQTHMGIEPSEFQGRRQAVMSAAPDGIILLHSFSAPKGWNESGFQQDSNFYYLTGLENLHDAILALDGTTKETWLFVMPPGEKEQRRFSTLRGWESAYLAPGHQAEQLLGIEHIVAWDGFSDFIDARLQANPKVVLYVDQGVEGKMVADVSNPPGLAPIENPYLLWSAAVRIKWPAASIADAGPILQTIRAVKSPAEIALMKTAAGHTDAGFRAAVAAIAPGRTNRQIEGAAIEGAFRAGADGIGMWPELKTGPVSSRTVFQKFYDYHLQNRTVQAGETVLMDLGFNYEHYKGDVGRTLPVSGQFTPEQREVIELMDGAYQSGVQAMRDGVSAAEIIRTCTGYAEEHRQGLHSELARGAAAELSKPGTWVMYTHGLDMVEIYPPKELHTGNTVAFGPDFDVDGEGFYEEDVVLITAAGYELINPPLPYSAAGIEQMMACAKQENAGTRCPGTNGDAQQKTAAMLAPVRAPAVGKSNYRVTLKLLDGTHVGNYSVTVQDSGDGWTVTGYWPAGSSTAGEMSDVATLETGTLLLRKETFRRIPNQAGPTSKPATTDLDFTGNKVSGATTSGSGEATPVSLELPAPIYPGGVAIDAVIGCLPLAKGYAATYRYWNIQTLQEGALQVKVVGTERITVPAGTFDSWKLELTTLDGSERGTLWIAQDSRTPVKSSGSKTVGRGTIYSSTELVP